MTDPIIQSIANILIERQQTIAVAESVTSGNVQVSLASATDATKFFQGGITAYNLGQKSRHLNVDPINAMACNCVAEQVAHEMAVGACKLFMLQKYRNRTTSYLRIMPSLTAVLLKSRVK
jgi:PncC family amidohydrolase